MKVRYLLLLLLSVISVGQVQAQMSSREINERIKAIQKELFELEELDYKSANPYSKAYTAKTNKLVREQQRLTELQRSDNSDEVKSIRAELHSLIEKKGWKKLTLAEFRRVDDLLNQLNKINSTIAVDIEESVYGSSCCGGLSDYQERHYKLELDTLFHKPNPKDKGWDKRARDILTKFFHGSSNSCGDSTDYNDYKKYKKRYEDITKKRFQDPS